MVETEYVEKIETEAETVPEDVVDVVDAVEDESEDVSRWSYFAIRTIEQEFKSKVDVKKWLIENGTQGFTIVRGRILPTGEKVYRKITLG